MSLSQKGEEWYGEVWYNEFTDDVTKINYHGSSEEREFFLFTEDTSIQGGIFPKGGSNPIYEREMCKGEECRDKYNVLTNYINKKEDLKDLKQLPKKNYDIRDEK